jgi:uncharacterized membrane protein
MAVDDAREDAGAAVPPHPSAEDRVVQNVEAIVALHALAEQQVDTHQRSVEALTAWLGRPQFFYGILVGVSLWMLVNGLAPRWGLQTRDTPPFFWMQGLVGLMGLLTTTVVLITQNRQGKIAERREQLHLQINLLAEQRTAKIIALLEELRRDLPSVQDRIDAEAQALSRAVDPQEVLATLESRMEQMVETHTAAVHTEEQATTALAPDEEAGADG